MSLIAQKVEPPPLLVQQMGNAILIECWRIGNAAAVLSRENIADASDPPNYRWHLSVAHPERKPTDAEFALGMEKFDLAATDCCIRVAEDEKQIDVWQLEDRALSRHWHFL